MLVYVGVCWCMLLLVCCYCNWSIFLVLDLIVDLDIIFLMSVIQPDSHLPPTDSRLRGDRLALEKGDLETAGKEKHRIEEEQRKIRKERESRKEEYLPTYFRKSGSSEEGGWKYVGDYWGDRQKRIDASKPQKH